MSMTGKYKCRNCGKHTDNTYNLELLSGNVIIHKCDDCEKKMDAEMEWQNEQWKEDDIICPFCNEHFSDYDDMCQITDNPYEDFEGNVKCPLCDKEFELEIETICTYTTRKPSEQFVYEDWLKSEAK